MIKENGLQPISPDADPAAAAFARLTEEVGVVRRLVAANDNTVTLGEIVQRLDRMVDAINVLAGRPAMKLTPDQMAEKIVEAVQQARAEDQAVIAQAKERMEKAVRLIEAQTGKIASIRQQRRRLAWVGGCGLLAGVLLWSFLPGTIVREAPARWHWPERLAAHVLGLDRWDAGERLLETADLNRWRAVVLGNSIVQDNQGAIATCLRQMQQLGKAVRCKILVVTDEGDKHPKS